MTPIPYEPANWKERIVQMVLVKQRLEEVDTEGLWEYRLPRVAASEETLQQVEAAIGMPLDPEYRDFLNHAGGWPAFYQSVDLFGPDELLGSPEFAAAREALLSMEDAALAECGEAPRNLLPIAATTEDLDLFLIAGPEANTPGQVFWYAGGLIDTFPTFTEYFLAMVDYNREEIRRLEGKAAGAPSQ
ncbi:SMI1/KNR4 family protein [Actinocrinis puniceicyclus]|uniref:SMI1/KNR4 family protein n=1 Tax=Actinocrinis puniceicyclus TaxID=977794 RepID=A0A8J8BGD3_9ACTN|nr:SMI1/KNR4 family protein [Actinocrinis puniceicyclus]MBS2965649.1 SMI1/KNR4 family protein [Actinocrinis puniceicyclus]